MGGPLRARESTLSRLQSGSMLRLVGDPVGPAKTGCDVIDEVVALLDESLPRVRLGDPCLADLRDLRDVLSVARSRGRRGL